MTTGAPANEGPERIRSITAFDAAVLAALLDRSFADQRWTESELETLLVMPGVFGSIAVKGTAPCGCILLRQAVDEGEVLWLAVLPALRRRGVARALFQAARRAAVARGISRLVLEVADDNEAARAFYDAQGFRSVGRRREYYCRPGGRACDAVVMATAISGLWQES